MKIKIITLNLYEGGLLDEAIAFLRAENPDILLLQEVFGHNELGAGDTSPFSSLEQLQATLPLPHSDFSPGLKLRTDRGLFIIGNAIFSRYPITTRDEVFYNEPFNDDFTTTPETNKFYPHTLQHAELQTPEGSVHAYNLHGPWDLVGERYSPERQQMADAILQAVTGKQKVLLGGDTNAKPVNEAIGRVEQELHSVFGHELESTFNMARKDNPGYATAAVDMLFVGRDVKVLEHDCPHVDVSDHLPLVAIVEL